jgi:hypothetical protein
MKDLAEAIILNEELERQGDEEPKTGNGGGEAK